MLHEHLLGNRLVLIPTIHSETPVQTVASCCYYSLLLLAVTTCCYYATTSYKRRWKTHLESLVSSVKTGLGAPDTVIELPVKSTKPSLNFPSFLSYADNHVQASRKIVKYLQHEGHPLNSGDHCAARLEDELKGQVSCFKATHGDPTPSRKLCTD